MARVARGGKSAKSNASGRKPGRPVGSVARASTKGAKAAAPKQRMAAVAPPARRKPGRPPKNSPPTTPMKTTRATKASTTKASAVRSAAGPAPKVSKDELRTQVEKLEATVAALRTRSREAVRAAKTAAARIAELEGEVARLEKATKASAPAPRPKAAKAPRAKRQSREIDPGDAVPPGVAVQEPAPLDEDAETALENLEEHLG